MNRWNSTVSLLLFAEDGLLGDAHLAGSDGEPTFYCCEPPMLVLNFTIVCLMLYMEMVKAQKQDSRLQNSRGPSIRGSSRIGRHYKQDDMRVGPPPKYNKRARSVMFHPEH